MRVTQKILTDRSMQNLNNILSRASHSGHSLPQERDPPSF